MSDAIDIFYWDACIFYEYLRDEPVEATKKLAIRELLLDNQQKRNRICTSVFTHLEVLPRKLPPDQEGEYWAQFGSQFFFDIELDRNVIALARELRDYYYAPTESGKVAKILSTGDSIQLATAVIHNVTEFHTRDGKSKGGNVPLLGLADGSAGGRLCGKYSLKIVSPEADQGELI